MQGSGYLLGATQLRAPKASGFLGSILDTEARNPLNPPNPKPKSSLLSGREKKNQSLRLLGSILDTEARNPSAQDATQQKVSYVPELFFADLGSGPGARSTRYYRSLNN